MQISGGGYWNAARSRQRVKSLQPLPLILLQMAWARFGLRAVSRKNCQPRKSLRGPNKNARVDRCSSDIGLKSLFLLGPLLSGVGPVPHDAKAEDVCERYFTSRGSTARSNSEKTAALPAPIALAATWSADLARQHGDVLGREARAHGHNILLGPVVDIARAPLAGRTFESFGEAPLRQACLAVPEIQAKQRPSPCLCRPASLPIGTSLSSAS